MLDTDKIKNRYLQKRVIELLATDDIDDDLYNFKIAQASLEKIDTLISSVNTDIDKFITIFENNFSLSYRKSYYEKCIIQFRNEITYIIFNRKPNSPYDNYCPSTKEYMQHRTTFAEFGDLQHVISTIKEISWI